jgi:hypothetical protein
LLLKRSKITVRALTTPLPPGQMEHLNLLNGVVPVAAPSGLPATMSEDLRKDASVCFDDAFFMKLEQVPILRNTFGRNLR